uniref:Uncharacterized protein n=1 Tax=Hyaloperonospora arabidopsidis (strain Emoy2) TaxID=559515 RepID=M4C672_HYAAE
MVQNPDYRAGNGQAQYMPTSQAGMAVMTPGGIITSVGFRNPDGTISQRTNTALQGNYFGGNGVVNQFNYGAVGGQWTVGGDWKLGQSYDRTSLEPESNRDGLFTRLSFDVADNLNVFAEASYNKNEAYQWGGTNSDKGQRDHPLRQRLHSRRDQVAARCTGRRRSSTSAPRTPTSRRASRQRA